MKLGADELFAPCRLPGFSPVIRVTAAGVLGRQSTMSFTPLHVSFRPYQKMSIIYTPLQKGPFPFLKRCVWPSSSWSEVRVVGRSWPTSCHSHKTSLKVVALVTSFHGTQHRPFHGRFSICFFTDWDVKKNVIQIRLLMKTMRLLHM